MSEDLIWIKEVRQMKETKIIRMIHILMGILIFMVCVVLVFSLAYFGVSKWYGSEEKQSDYSQEQGGQTDKDEPGIDDEEKKTQEISSKDKTITIYNGTKINGLAGRWKKKLTEDGYQIARVDNYSESKTTGVILVTEEGMGLDLQREYFPEAEIQVGTPADDADIQIILGESEDDRE